ncbi:MAG: UDP-N-acetylmuramate dehydrogenase [Bacteroidota bacterium]
MISVEKIKSLFRGKISINEPMAKYTSFRIGGPADFYCEPIDKKDLISLVQYFSKEKFPFIIIGRGSNLLISDEGIRGAVINLEKQLNSLTIKDEIVTAESGARLAIFVDFCIQRSLVGVEMLAGIPGTIGGAVVMNAGAYGGEISDNLTEVEILRNGELKKIKKSEAEFSYRHSAFSNDIVLSASFKLQKGDVSQLLNRRRELLLKRNSSQPLNLPNSGSVFKNPIGTHAGKLVEEAGLKGFQFGGAKISDKHGNFIVNLGDAKAKDIIELIHTAQDKVFARTNIKLQLEVKLVGFTEDEMVLVK